MTQIIKNNTTIYNSNMTAEEYKKKIIQLDREVKKMWREYYKLIKK